MISPWYFMGGRPSFFLWDRFAVELHMDVFSVVLPSVYLEFAYSMCI